MSKKKRWKNLPLGERRRDTYRSTEADNRREVISESFDDDEEKKNRGKNYFQKREDADAGVGEKPAKPKPQSSAERKRPAAGVYPDGKASIRGPGERGKKYEKGVTLT